MLDYTIYHIYAKDKCLYNSLTKEEFEIRWSQVQAMVGLMKTDYNIEDLSYEELPGGVGGYQTRNWNDPDGEDSY